MFSTFAQRDGDASGDVFGLEVRSWTWHVLIDLERQFFGLSYRKRPSLGGGEEAGLRVVLSHKGRTWLGEGERCEGLSLYLRDMVMLGELGRSR